MTAPERSPAFRRGTARAKADKAAADAEVAEVVRGEVVHVPNPTTDLVPSGWAEQIAKPAIQETTSWERLDEVEERIRKMVALAEAGFVPGGAVYELRCAWRLIEIRRGQLLEAAAAPRGRPRSGAEKVPPVGQIPDVPKQTASRYRQLAANPEQVEAHLWSTKDPHAVTQKRCLAVARDHAGDASPRPDPVPDDDHTCRCPVCGNEHTAGDP